MTLVVDTSVLVAIISEEPDADSFRLKLAAERDARIAAPNVLELLMVLASRRGDATARVETLLMAFSVTVAPFTPELVPLAHDAFLQFGKGRHPAALNFGDCIAYAFARSLRAPLLFKGRDFALTDVIPAL